MDKNNRARDELKQILNQEEYQVYYQDNRSVFVKWWDQFKSWALDLISSWFSNLEPSSNLAEGVFFVIVTVVILVLLIVLFFIIRMIKRKHAFHHQQPLQAMGQKNWTHLDYIQAAKIEANKQAYSAATRHWFIALLLYFHELKWLEAKMWKTNWEYYAELENVNKETAEQFYHLALIFDQVTYGKRQMRKEDYLVFERNVNKWLNVEQTKPTIEG